MMNTSAAPNLGIGPHYHPTPIAAISTNRLTKVFGRDEVLRSIDLEVPVGSVCLLAGSNGAGKSTLLHLLLNLEQPTSGTAMVAGHNAQCEGPTVRSVTGYMSEAVEPGYRWMRVGQLLKHRALLFPSWDESYANYLVEELDVRLDKVIGKLSKGQARRVQFITALAHRPAVLLLDEPTDGFDPIIRDKVVELLAAHLADTGCTTIISTHLAAEVDGLIDHVAFLHKGQLLWQGHRDVLLTSVRRYELETTDNWVLPAAIQGLPYCLERTLGRRCLLLVQGDHCAIKGALTASEACIRAESGVSLGEATLLILKNGDQS